MDWELFEKNRRLVEFQMQMLQAQIHMQAMIADNKAVELHGGNPIYTGKDFVDLIDKYGIHANAFPY